MQPEDPTLGQLPPPEKVPPLHQRPGGTCCLNSLGFCSRFHNFILLIHIQMPSGRGVAWQKELVPETWHGNPSTTIQPVRACSMHADQPTAEDRGLRWLVLWSCCVFYILMVRDMTPSRNAFLSFFGWGLSLLFIYFSKADTSQAGTCCGCTVRLLNIRCSGQ